MRDIKHFYMALSWVLNWRLWRVRWGRFGEDGEKQDDRVSIFCWKPQAFDWHIRATHRQCFPPLHRKTCLIFLSTRVNIWHKEALDSGRTIRGRHRMGRGHERGPSWIQLAPGVKFQTTSPSSYKLSHRHTPLACVHVLDAQTCTFTQNTHLKTMCRMFSVETCSS